MLTEETEVGLLVDVVVDTGGAEVEVTGEVDNDELDVVDVVVDFVVASTTPTAAMIMIITTTTARITLEMATLCVLLESMAKVLTVEVY